MKLDEWKCIVRDCLHAIVESTEGSSLVTLRLPFKARKQLLAIEERSALLLRIRSAWSSTFVVYDDGGHLKKSQLPLNDSLDGLSYFLDIGGWVMIFGEAGSLTLTEVMAEGGLALMNIEDILESTNAGCIIVSEPDDTEWTILFQAV
jgi:hypothetical protein